MPNIVVPTLGESVVEARVAKWLKQEGQAVSAGEPVVELETEKIDLEVSAEVSGVLTSITRREGEDVKIGEVLGVVSEGASATAPAAAPAAEAAKPADAGSRPAHRQAHAAAPARPRPPRRPNGRWASTRHAPRRRPGASPKRTPWIWAASPARARRVAC